MYFSIKRFWLLISLFTGVLFVSAQSNKPKPKKITIESPRPGVENQKQFDSIKNALDRQRFAKKKGKNPKIKK